MAYKSENQLLTQDELKAVATKLKAKNYRKIEGGSSKLPIGKPFKCVIKGYRVLQNDEELTYFTLYVFTTEVDGKVVEDTCIQNGKFQAVGETVMIESYTDAKSGRIFNRFAVKKVEAKKEAAPALTAEANDEI